MSNTSSGKTTIQFLSIMATLEVVDDSERVIIRSVRIGYGGVKRHLCIHKPLHKVYSLCPSTRTPTLLHLDLSMLLIRCCLSQRHVLVAQ